MEKKIESYKSKKEKDNSEQFNISPRSLEDVLKSHVIKDSPKGEYTWVSPTYFFLEENKTLPYFGTNEPLSLSVGMFSQILSLNRNYGAYISAPLGISAKSISAHPFPTFLTKALPNTFELQGPYKNYAPFKELDLLQSKTGIDDIVEKNLKAFEDLNPLADPVVRVKDKITYEKDLKQRRIREEYSSRIDFAASYFGNDTDDFRFY